MIEASRETQRVVVNRANILKVAETIAVIADDVEGLAQVVPLKNRLVFRRAVARLLDAAAFVEAGAGLYPEEINAPSPPEPLQPKESTRKKGKR